MPNDRADHKARRARGPRPPPQGSHPIVSPVPGAHQTRQTLPSPAGRACRGPAPARRSCFLTTSFSSASWWKAAKVHANVYSTKGPCIRESFRIFILQRTPSSVMLALLLCWSAAAAPPATVILYRVDIGLPPATARPISPGFVGLSIETYARQAMLGTPAQPKAALARALANFARMVRVSRHFPPIHRDLTSCWLDFRWKMARSDAWGERGPRAADRGQLCRLELRQFSQVTSHLSLLVIAGSILTEVACGYSGCRRLVGRRSSRRPAAAAATT